MKLFGNKKNARNLDASDSSKASARGSGRHSEPKKDEKKAEPRRKTPAQTEAERKARQSKKSITLTPEQGQPAQPAPNTRRPRKKKRSRTWKRAVIIIAAILVAAILVLLMLLKAAVKAPTPTANTSDVTDDTPDKTTTETVKDVDENGNEITYDVAVPASVNENIYNVLVVGMDKVGENTDTMMLMSYNSEKKTVSVLSLPRDTMANINNKYSRKLNSEYAAGGIEGLVGAVEDIVGFPVDYYICVDLEGFAVMVDSIGGITYDVPFRMYYTDPAQGLTIDFYDGEQLLDGEDCCNMLRWRQNNSNVSVADANKFSAQGDLGRIQLQQRFLKAVISQMISVKNIGQIGTLSKVMEEYVETNLTVGEMAWLGLQTLSSVSSENVNFMTVPGEGIYFNNLSFYEIDASDLLDMVNTYFNPYTNAQIELGDMDIICVSNGTIVSLSGKTVLNPGSQQVSTNTDTDTDTDSSDDGTNTTDIIDTGTDTTDTDVTEPGTGGADSSDPGIGLPDDSGSEAPSPDGTPPVETPNEAA